MMRRLLFCLLLLCAFPVHAAVETPAVHGIAMHGEPKYAADFKRFEYVNPNAPKQGMLKLGLTGTFDSLNPWIVRGNPAAYLTYTYDTLLARSQDEPFSLYGLLAEKLAVTPKRDAVTFYLRPIASWHDGKPVTAADVHFSWETLRKQGRPNHRSYYNKVARVEIENDHTITFYFAPDRKGVYDREIPLIIGMMPILSKAYWEGKKFDDTTLTPFLGSGPYRIAAATPGRQIIYERVKDYWARSLPANVGLYNFDKIIIDYYRDEAVALEAFKSQAFDLKRESDPARWASAYDSFNISIGDIVKEELPHQRVEPIKAFAFNLRRPIFKDEVMRKAVSYAFDHAWVNRALYADAYKRLTSYFGATDLAAKMFPDDYERKLVENYRHTLGDEVVDWRPALTKIKGAVRERLALAARRLKAARYQVVNGQLYFPNNQPVTFEILINDPSDEKVALSFAQNLKQLGISVKVRTVDSAQYQARLTEFDYDMTLVRWVNSLSPGNEQWIYWGGPSADVKGSRNYTGIKNDGVDQIIARLIAARTRDELTGAAKALDRALQSQYVSIPLFALGRDLVAYAKRLKRPAVTPLYGYVLESWWDSGATDAEKTKARGGSR